MTKQFLALAVAASATLMMSGPAHADQSAPVQTSAQAAQFADNHSTVDFERGGGGRGGGGRGGGGHFGRGGGFRGGHGGFGRGGWGRGGRGWGRGGWGRGYGWGGWGWGGYDYCDLYPYTPTCLF